MENISLRVAKRSFAEFCRNLADGEQADFAVLDDGGTEAWITVHASHSATVPHHMRIAYELDDMDWADIEESLWGLTQLGIEVMLKTSATTGVYLRSPADKLDQLGSDALQLILQQYANLRLEQDRRQRTEMLETQVIPDVIAAMEAARDEAVGATKDILDRRAQLIEAILRDHRRPGTAEGGTEA
jgi:hypothetical protein